MVRFVAPLILAAAVVCGTADAYPSSLECKPDTWTVGAAFPGSGMRLTVPEFSSPATADNCKIVATPVDDKTCEYSVVISSSDGGRGFKLGADEGSFDGKTCSNTGVGSKGGSHTATFKGGKGQTLAKVSGLCGLINEDVMVAAPVTLVLLECDGAAASLAASTGALLLAVATTLRML
jgi:hypothetical protein